VKILLTDTQSPLGQALLHELEREPYALLCPSNEVDWLDFESVSAYLQRHQPDLIINALGWSEWADVEWQQLLIGSARNLAKACAQQGGIPLQLSSYRVFGGEQKDCYEVGDRPSPLGVVGRAFWDAERLYDASLDKWLVLRLGWVFGVQENNRLSNTLQALRSGESVEAGGDYFGAPTTVLDVARVVVAMVRQVLCGADNWGLYQYVSSDICSELEFVQELAAILQETGDFRGAIVEPAEQDALQGSAVLGNQRLLDNFGVKPRTWRQGLGETVRLWLKRNPV
jgi:dTDP-4-dehydrorhamnose reductase|tara:strand:- start:72 stop:923 length:852 start_codon:yes stop_codon:yes gene_type:complete